MSSSPSVSEGAEYGRNQERPRFDSYLERIYEISLKKFPHRVRGFSNPWLGSFHLMKTVGRS
jgi:hypothetical protein